MPLSAQQQQGLLKTLARQELQLKKLKRRIHHLEHEQKLINTMYESTNVLRDSDAEEKERQYLYNRVLLDACPSMLMVLDMATRYVTGTGKLVARYFEFGDALKLTALPLREILGGSVQQGWIDKTVENCHRVLHERNILHYNDSIDYLDNHKIYVSITISAVVDGADQLLGVVFMLHDITDVARLPSAPSTRVQLQGHRPQDTIGSFRTENVTALVVDDNEINLMVAAEILKYYAIRTVTAGSGAEAIRLAESGSFDLIFMDHMMPEMDGIETTARIRELGGRNSHVPIIALTANAIVGTRKMFLQNRMDDYLSKPIDVGKLNGILRRWLPAEKLRASPSAQPQAAPALQSEALQRVAATCPLEVAATLAQIGGSEKTYLTILRTFLGNIQNRLDSMAGLLARSAWDQYRVEIHSQKSALYNIGARTLSKQAGKLELAASGGNYDYIHQNFGGFLADATDLQKKLLAIFPRESQADSPPTSPAALAALPQAVLAIIALLDDLENDLALEKITALTAWSYGRERDPLLDMARTAIDNFDYDTAASCLRQLLDMGETR